MRTLSLLLIAPFLSGCVVGQVVDTAVDVVTLPVDIAGEVVDIATTSQAEADQKRGRKLRKAEERHGKELRKWEKTCRKARKRDRECEPRPVFQPPA
ncbi:hypothetical protein [Sphingomicrobium lutaoense]|uniref:Lipoprotein n=1 Tax=Sphingomicrobium lutaoense TaxID=515949 RepID=A0A839YX18_9SPHN|nr:hypothetical protein [Sphingomicrobium lutaoense]MBB3763030.1 hypothetical protein [Sphingomicrobium lutaoense]